MKVTIRKANLADIPLIRALSESIWKRHYISIISLEQIEYMLAKMYSTEQLSKDITNPNYTYFIASADGIDCGYMAISVADADSYFLNKFYIQQENQQQGLGEAIFKLVFDNLSYSQIQLFVNRQNFKSVNFYFKMGFKIADVVDNHFGDGYYMNDFRMIKESSK